MKVNKKKTSAIRHYHISLMVFLVMLGLAPASLTTNKVSANTEKATGQAANIAGIPEIKNANAASEVEIAEIAGDFLIGETPVKNVKTVETPVAYDQINIAGNTVPIFYSDNTLIDAGNQVGLYGKHFLYGHNATNVFGGLSGMNIGDRFTVTLNGVTKTYQVVNYDLQTKSHFEEEVTVETKLTGVRVVTTMKMMKAITAYGEYDGIRYDYILMTCAGTSYGNGDASHRLILMANEV